MEAHLSLPLENFAQTSTAVNIVPFLTGAFPRSHQKQSPSHAADQATLGTEKGQGWTIWTSRDGPDLEITYTGFLDPRLRRSQQTWGSQREIEWNQHCRGEHLCEAVAAISIYLGRTWEPGIGEPCIPPHIAVGIKIRASQTMREITQQSDGLEQNSAIFVSDRWPKQHIPAE